MCLNVFTPLPTTVICTPGRHIVHVDVDTPCLAPQIDADVIMDWDLPWAVRPSKDQQLRGALGKLLIAAICLRKIAA